MSAGLVHVIVGVAFSTLTCVVTVAPAFIGPEWVTDSVQWQAAATAPTVEDDRHGRHGRRPQRQPAPRAFAGHSVRYHRAREPRQIAAGGDYYLAT
jgi:hypothetical protein